MSYNPGYRIPVCAIVERVLQSGLSHAGSRATIRAAASKACQTAAYKSKLSLSAGQRREVAAQAVCAVYKLVQRGGGRLVRHVTLQCYVVAATDGPK